MWQNLNLESLPRPRSAPTDPPPANSATLVPARKRSPPPLAPASCNVYFDPKAEAYRIVTKSRACDGELRQCPEWNSAGAAQHEIHARWVGLVSSPLPPHSSALVAMVTLLAAKARPPKPNDKSGAISSLNAAIDVLSVARDAVEVVPAKGVFASVITILALVRVRTIITGLKASISQRL